MDRRALLKAGLGVTAVAAVPSAVANVIGPAPELMTWEFPPEMIVKRVFINGVEIGRGRWFQMGRTLIHPACEDKDIGVLMQLTNRWLETQIF